jgi:hypothetical protein
MDGPKMKAYIPLFYSVPLEVLPVKKMFDYLPNGSVNLN